MRIKGKITSWNEDKGYGFIMPLAGGRKVFIHVSALSHRDRHLGIDQIVTYDLSTDKQGRPCAINVVLPGDRLQKKRAAGNFSIFLAIVFIGIVATLVLVGKLPVLIFGIYSVLSLLTFFLYYLDKVAAKNGAWRTSEATLHVLSLIGGWPGALIAQQKLRHKSKKKPFRFVFWITVLINIGGFLWLFSREGEKSLNSLLDFFKNLPWE